MRRRVTLIVMALLLTGCYQSQVSPWQGSWGTFAGEWGDEHGHALQLTQCTKNHCEASLDVQAGYNNLCSVSGSLTVQSRTAASLQLQLPADKSTATCTVKLIRQSSGGDVLTLTGAEGCANVCSKPETWAPVADATYPKKADAAFLPVSTTHFWDEHDKIVDGATLEDCYRSPSASLHALCLDAAMVALSQQREAMIASTPGSFDKTQDIVKLEAACDKSPQPGSCLRDSLNQDIAKLHAIQAEFNAPGDPTQAAKKIAAIVGTYRHSFENELVSGESFRSTDKMTIARSSPTAIDFDIDLNFYNGHTCGIAGTAEYKKNGSFVFIDTDSDPSGGRCLLELTPTAKGIDFGDPTGSCKMQYCGMRGGIDGNGFTFAQKQSK